MSDATIANDSLRQRLRLALGARAELGEEVDGGPYRAFRATLRDGGAAAVVTVHPAPPAGPDAAVIAHRMTELRALGHGAIDLPLADGDVGNAAWVIEPISDVPSARECVSVGLFPLALGVSLTRDLARLLVAMHRRGIAHGAISLDTVRIDVDHGTLRLGGAGQGGNASVRHDLDGLADVAWALLSGELTYRSGRALSTIRRGVVPSLDALCAALLAADPHQRPQRAEAVLEALDAVPSRRHAPLSSLVDAGTNDGRPRRALAWLVVGGAIALLVVLLLARG